MHADLLFNKMRREYSTKPISTLYFGTSFVCEGEGQKPSRDLTHFDSKRDANAFSGNQISSRLETDNNISEVTSHYQYFLNSISVLQRRLGV